MPSMIAQSLAPVAAAWLIEQSGVPAALWALEILALANVAAALTLVPAARRN
jgi:hypothetical protein